MAKKVALPANPHLQIMHRRSVIVLAILMVFAALKIAASFFIPLVVSLFLIAIAWQIKTWLDKLLPSSLSYTGSMLALLAVFILFFGSFYIIAADVAEQLPKYKDAFQDIFREAKRELSMNGVKTSQLEVSDLREGFALILSYFRYSLIYVVIIMGYIIMAIPEMATWRLKLRACFGRENDAAILEKIERINIAFKKYIIAMVISGLLSAFATAGFSLAIGLDFAFTWGILAFLLSFIPNIGAVLSVVPVVLFSFLQFDGYTEPMIILVGLSLIQLFLGFVVDTKLQANMLAISPFATLLSIAFWGFLWGIPGALLATPLTYTIIMICEHFDTTKWISCLLVDTCSPTKSRAMKKA